MGCCGVAPWLVLVPSCPSRCFQRQVFLLCERCVGNSVVFSRLLEGWPWVICRVADFHLLFIPT